VRRRPVVVAAAVALLVVAIALGVLYVGVHRVPTERTGETVRFEVSRGESFSAVAARLYDGGVVVDPRALRVYAKLRRVDRSIKTGTYEFTIGEPPLEVLGRLVDGDILKVAVTIPEGFTTWDIAGAFRAAGVDSVAMLAATRDSTERARRRIDALSLEGYLFPDTYVVPWGVTPREVIRMMTARLDDVFVDSLFARAVDIGMTPHEVLTLASIVEAEARVDGERPVISAVYHNRLRRGMKLEADPTVAYAMGGYRGRLLYADLEIDSPYNTYRHTGLPPGPICSPGAASIHAALYPDATTSALYFVARGDGSHVFSDTLREHRAAVRRARQDRDRRKP